MADPIEFLLNDELVRATDAPGTLVLDWLRVRRGLTGTKEGCKEGDCGACCVLVGHLDGDRVRYRVVTSCLVPLGELHGRHLVTVEGVTTPAGNPAQRALVARGGAQCGYCTPGFVVSMTWQLLEGDALDRAGFRDAIGGNLCRCTGYGSILRACDDVIAEQGGQPRGVEALCARGDLPPFFATAAARLRAIGPAAPTAHPDVWVAGGTDLYVQRGEQLPAARVGLLNLRGGLGGVRVADGAVHLGPLVTFEEFARHPAIRAMIPTIGDDMALVASLPIRSRATLAGNLVNASPIGDLTALLLALGAEIDVGARTMPLEALYRGYKQLAKEPEELVTAIRFPAVADPTRVSFEKVSKRRFLDIASVNSAARITVIDGVVRDARISVGGVAPTPLLARECAAALVGRALDGAAVRDALDRLDGEIAPISDVRGSAAYKRLLARNLVAAHLVRGWPERVSLRDVLGEGFAA